jgi:hypothetical protein
MVLPRAAMISLPRNRRKNKFRKKEEKMKSNIFFKTTGCLLIVALLFIPVISADTDSLNLIRNDKGNMVYHDSHAGKTWEGPPPPSELLEGKPHWKKLELLDNWTTQVSRNDKELYRKYFECKNQLDRLDKKLAKADGERPGVQKDYERERKELQKLLLKAMTNLGLQTTLILADGITDVYLTGKAFKDSIAQDPKDIKGARAKAEMIAEAEKLTRKAAAGRRLAAEALAKLEEAQRQLALARAAKDDAVTTQKGRKKPSEVADSVDESSKPPSGPKAPHGTDLVDNSNSTQYSVYDSNNNQLQAFAKVENTGRGVLKDGEIAMVLRTKWKGKRSPLLKGSEQFKKILKHFRGRFKGIRGSWSYGDNLNTFNRLIRKGLSPEEAALKTWTGQQASGAGYTKVIVRSLEGTPGNFKKVVVTFTKQ